MQKVNRDVRILERYIDYLHEQAKMWRKFYKTCNVCLKDVERDKQSLEDEYVFPDKKQ